MAETEHRDDSTSPAGRTKERKKVCDVRGGSARSEIQVLSLN